MTDYFANGARLGWVIRPEEQSVIVFSSTAPVVTVVVGETLDGSDAIPCLSIPVADLFA